MSTPNEVFFEPLVSNGSNYASWSTHVLNAFRTMGPNVERILVVSILPPKFDINLINWTNITQEKLDCTQLNACLTNFLRSILCEDIQDAIFEMKEIRHDAHLIWATLKDTYDEAKCDVQVQEVSESVEGCTTSSAEIKLQMTASKIQEGKDSADRDFTFAVAAYPDESDSDSDSDDEDLLNELRKMSNRIQTTIIEMMKKQVIVEDCNDNLVQENEVLKQEVERLLKDLTKMKGKGDVQPSQDNRETMVKKLEKGSTVQSSCNQAHKSN
ncbi:hypothetical protein C2845_PM04G11540 [Panicum miliaceum]|uniref:Uncharacterized protein n=1 Tax=Panicum miliaceum TaxID=4540 RepID=A0A3L6QQD5_PANMI|nr:hypothetical protein C2845_PM04G11540 [Panicum miliaceum]